MVVYNRGGIHNFLVFNIYSQVCIKRDWLCDGQDDCDDQSDETSEVCETIKCDKERHFQCDNRKCIPKWWTCDEIDHCGDGSDESNVTCKNFNSTPEFIHVISPYFGGISLYLPIFEKISLRKFSEFPIYLIYLPIWNFRSPYQNSEFPSLFNHSPYLEKKISLFVFWDVSHVCLNSLHRC